MPARYPAKKKIGDHSPAWEVVRYLVVRAYFLYLAFGLFALIYGIIHFS